MTKEIIVTPAEAGVCVTRNVKSETQIPAFAGMTG